MTTSQKQEQGNFFKRIASLTTPGGTYIWPDERESYTIINGKFSAATSRGKALLIATTNPDFHKDYIL